MAAADTPRFVVSELPDVVKETAELGRQATEAGERQALVETLKAIMKQLEEAPLTWGDPEYHPNKPGSTVLHGTMSGLLVRYVVYEPERSVLILKVQRM